MKKILILTCFLFLIISNVAYCSTEIYQIGAGLKRSKFQKTKPYYSVNYVFVDSPAYLAGVKKGDKIISFDNQQIRKIKNIFDNIKNTKTNTYVIKRHFEEPKEYIITGVNLTKQNTSEPLWTEFCPQDLIFMTKEISTIYTRNQRMNYWKQRRIQFDSELNLCNGLDDKNNISACHARVREVEFAKNAQYNQAIAQRQAAISASVANFGQGLQRIGENYAYVSAMNYNTTMNSINMMQLNNNLSGINQNTYGINQNLNNLYNYIKFGY